MAGSSRSAGQGRFRPIVVGLESRDLLSTAHAAVHAAAHRTAQVVNQFPSVVSQLNNATPQVISTVTSGGEFNPYGTAFVPVGFPKGGLLKQGDLLISNFNNSQNLQGTGSTIVKISPNGTQSLFWQGRPGLGLTGALGVLEGGYVVVGSVPTLDGTPNTVQQGSLFILDKFGKVVLNLSDSKLLDGPWGLAVNDPGTGEHPQLFVSNVLNGTVTRIDLSIPATTHKLQVLGMTAIGSGFSHRTDPAAIVLGPSGLAFDPAQNLLYVASSTDNAIYTIPNAATTVTNATPVTPLFQDLAHLHGPLDLLIAPNGNLIVANSDGPTADPNQPSAVVEFTTAGQFVAQYFVDPGIDGAFGIALRRTGANTLAFAAVNDNASNVQVFAIQG